MRWRTTFGGEGSWRGGGGAIGTLWGIGMGPFLADPSREGGTKNMRAPLDPISMIFMQFSAKMSNN